MIYNLGDKSILFKKLSIRLQNDFDSNLLVSDKYTLELSKCIYNYLLYTYDNASYLSDLIVSDAQKISDVYLSKVKLYKDITINPDETAINNHIYDRNTSVPGYEYQTNIDSIDKITKYNIAFWPIDDNLLQYITVNTVITPNSSFEDIASMQKLLSNIQSTIYDYTPGIWDYKFSEYCYNIQSNMKSTNKDIILTGLCDLYVEKYLRSHNEIRNNSYHN